MWTSKIKLHLLVRDTLITPPSEGIQSKSKLCPSKTALLISSPIKSISCPRAYFRPFISPVASSNRFYQALHLRMPGVMSAVCPRCLIFPSASDPLFFKPSLALVLPRVELNKLGLLNRVPSFSFHSETVELHSKRTVAEII